MSEHAIHRIHELLQQEQEELFCDAARIHRLLAVKDHLDDGVNDELTDGAGFKESGGRVWLSPSAAF